MIPKLAPRIRKRILVVCPTDWEQAAISSPLLQDSFEFLTCGEELLGSIGVLSTLRFHVESYLQGIVHKYRHRGIDGVLGTGDYPGCMFSAVIAQGLGLPAPQPRDSVLLSHKYHSRQLQLRIVPEATPHFDLIDPYKPRKPRSLHFPFFVKPVKGTMSIRAQMVHSEAALRQATHFTVRDQLRFWSILNPYSQLLRQYQQSPVPIHFFIAEAPLSGVQVTVDGFVQNGVSTVMGITDSIMYPGTNSFARFEYPSSLPHSVQARMIHIANRLMSASGFDHSCYNIEMFYDQAADSVSIIEINPRMSYQFSDLFARVDGQSSFSVQLDLATGESVQWLRSQGPSKVAASFVMRLFHDARVQKVPSPSQLSDVQQRFPDTVIKVLCSPGERLSHHDQDVGSYRYCIVNMAANSKQELHAHYDQVRVLLPFEFV